MLTQGRNRHFVSSVLAWAVWLCLGLMMPIVIGLYSSDVTLRDAVVAAPRHSFTIAHPVVLRAAPNIRVERGTIVLVDATGKPVSPVSDAGGRGSLPPIAGSNLLLENALVTFAGHGLADAGGALDSAGEATKGGLLKPVPETFAPLVDALATTKYESLLLRRTTILLALGGQVSEPLNDVQASVSIRRKGIVAIKGMGLLRGQRVSFDLVANSLVGDAKGPDKRTALKLSIKAALIEAQFEGRIATDTGLDLIGQGEVSIRNVRPLARWLGANWSPGPGLRNVFAKGQLSFSNQTLAFEQAIFRTDGNDATGAVAMAFAGKRPQLTGTLAFKSLDAGPYLFEVARDQDVLSWATVAAGALTVPLGMNLDADVRVSAERGRLAGLEFGRSAATIVLKDGRMLADIAELGFAGGGGGGQIGADFTGYQPKMSLRGRLERIDLGLVSQALTGHGVVQAPASVVADLHAIGATAPELLRSLGGKLSIKSQDGGTLGLDLKQLAAGLQGHDAIGWPVSAARGRTPFEQLELKLIVRDGVLLTETAEATVAEGAWTATGLLNLPQQRMDIRLIQSLPAGLFKASSAPMRPAVMEVRGPWSSPLIRTLTEPSNAAGSGDKLLDLPTRPSAAGGRKPG